MLKRAKQYINSWAEEALSSGLAKTRVKEEVALWVEHAADNVIYAIEEEQFISPAEMKHLNSAYKASQPLLTEKPVFTETCADVTIDFFREFSRSLRDVSYRQSGGGLRSIDPLAADTPEWRNYVPRGIPEN